MFGLKKIQLGITRSRMRGPLALGGINRDMSAGIPRRLSDQSIFFAKIIGHALKWVVRKKGMGINFRASRRLFRARRDSKSMKKPAARSRRHASVREVRVSPLSPRSSIKTRRIGRELFSLALATASSVLSLDTHTLSLGLSLPS